MLEQLTEKPWYSPFPQYQVTERPDRTALELLNGKIALLCDNSPSALILPGAFSSFMESSEDWYHHFEMATFLRILRYLALLTATLLPGLYLAVIRYTDIANESFAVFCRCKGGSTFFKCDRTGFTGTRF